MDPPDDPEYDDEWPGIEVGEMQVVVTEPVLLGTLLGPDGEVIRAMYDRRIIPFGFQRRSRCAE